MTKCKWDKVFLKWLQDRGYETRHDGEGHIHIHNAVVKVSVPVKYKCDCQEAKLYTWEIDAFYKTGFVLAIGRGGERHLDMADPDFFVKLGEVFPRRQPHNPLPQEQYSICLCESRGRWGFLVRLRGWVSWLGRACSRW